MIKLDGARRPQVLPGGLEPVHVIGIEVDGVTDAGPGEPTLPQLVAQHDLLAPRVIQRAAVGEPGVGVVGCVGGRDTQGRHHAEEPLDLVVQAGEVAPAKGPLGVRVHLDLVGGAHFGLGIATDIGDALRVEEPGREEAHVGTLLGLHEVRYGQLGGAYRVVEQLALGGALEAHREGADHDEEGDGHRDGGHRRPCPEGVGPCVGDDVAVGLEVQLLWYWGFDHPTLLLASSPLAHSSHRPSGRTSCRPERPPPRRG